MTPLIQTHFYAGDDPDTIKGNCWQTCWASLFDLPLDAVPHFVELDGENGVNWFNQTIEWVNKQGFHLYSDETEPDIDDYYLVTGKSPRGDYYHVVLYKDGQLAHDPHPDGTGILTQENFVWVRPHN